MKKLLLSLAIAFIVQPLTWAQSPKAFNYQAVARDNAGQVLSEQPIGLRISILEGSFDGLAVFIETHQESTNEFGLLNLKIGAGINLLGDLNEIDWGANDYFLKIEMDIEGGNNYVEMGTSQLLSVPYALYATKSDTANAAYFADQSNLAETAGYAEQAGTAAEAEFANNAVNAQQASFAENALNAQTANFAQEADFAQTSGNSYWTKDKEDIYFDSQGSVGIGAQPSAKLHVHQGDIYLDTVGTGIIIRDEAGGCWRFTIDTVGRFKSTKLDVCPGEE